MKMVKIILSQLMQEIFIRTCLLTKWIWVDPLNWSLRVLQDIIYKNSVILNSSQLTSPSNYSLLSTLKQNFVKQIMNNQNLKRKSALSLKRSIL